MVVNNHLLVPCCSVHLLRFSLLADICFRKYVKFVADLLFTRRRPMKIIIFNYCLKNVDNDLSHWFLKVKSNLRTLWCHSLNKETQKKRVHQRLGKSMTGSNSNSQTTNSNRMVPEKVQEGRILAWPLMLKVFPSIPHSECKFNGAVS